MSGRFIAETVQWILITIKFGIGWGLHHKL